MSQIVEFYAERGADGAGRTLRELWSWDDEELELTHDFIQWLFPLPEPSRFNPDAPLLSDADIAAFKASDALRVNLRRSFDRIMRFLGLQVTEQGEVVEGPNFAERVPDAWESPNHNWLRITRILRCLKLCGLHDESQQLFRRLETLQSSGKYPIDAETSWYWKNAAR